MTTLRGICRFIVLATTLIVLASHATPGIELRCYADGTFSDEDRRGLCLLAFDEQPPQASAWPPAGETRMIGESIRVTTDSLLASEPAEFAFFFAIIAGFFTSYLFAPRAAPFVALADFILMAVWFLTITPDNGFFMSALLDDALGALAARDFYPDPFLLLLAPAAIIHAGVGAIAGRRALVARALIAAGLGVFLFATSSGATAIPDLKEFTSLGMAREIVQGVMLSTIFVDAALAILASFLGRFTSGPSREEDF
ncbi:MAG: hypothetical protein GC152_03385 [Alphaproteobacteria bacterium]|nr:hypothetical protein [Alphaproteobacteria bacterium]